MSRPIHLLLRYGDAFLSVDDTVAKHQAVIEKLGAVWFGKIGKPLSKRNIDILNKQIINDQPTHLFLTKKSKGGLRVYQGRVVEVARRLPNGQKRLVPPYYARRDIPRYVRLWIKLAGLKEIDNSSLLEWHVASSGTNLARTVAKSMAAMFVIAEGRGITY